MKIRNRELKGLIFHRDQVIELSTCIFNVLHFNSTNIRLTCFMKKTNHVQLDNCKALLSFDVNGALVRISLIFFELNKVSKTSHLDTSVHHHPRNLFGKKLDREFVLLKGQPTIMKEKMFSLGPKKLVF